MTEEPTAIERLADRIDATLARGERRYVLEGAELDWVRDAIRHEIKRLRAALTSIANHELRDHEDYTEIQDMAEAALRPHDCAIDYRHGADDT